MAFIIKSFFNDTSSTATVTLDAENSFSVSPGHPHDLNPNWVVPVAASAAEYANNHIRVLLSGNSVPFTFWANKGKLYYSQSDSWNDTQLLETVVNGDLQYQILVAATKPWIVGEILEEG